MASTSLLDFASDQMLTLLLVKERAKYRRRNRNEKHHHLDKECPIDELTTRKRLSRMMPPRRTWMRPSKNKRRRLENGAVDTSKNAEKSLLITIKRDRKLQQQGTKFDYLDEMQRFFDRIRTRLRDDNLRFESPKLLPIFKKAEPKGDGTYEVTCRPLSVYANLEDKIIIALASRYLTGLVDRQLHENILSYRPARRFRGKNHYVPDFNDGIAMIEEYRLAHDNGNIYAADCDIKKFYDVISHEVVMDCFGRLLDDTDLDDEGRRQVERVIKAYLASYNFYTNALKEAEANPEVFFKVRRRFRDSAQHNTYKLGWVDELLKGPQEERCTRGVPQGGSLSLLVANVVLNDVDRVFTEKGNNENMLFIRYCDDMILLHTDREECQRLMKEYVRSLKDHGLYYHPFEDVADSKCGPEGEDTNDHFWNIKSHSPFLWGIGGGDSNRYIGFLGYEMTRDGRMRLRRSNIERFVEKYRRQRHALRRYRKKHTEEKFEEHSQKVLNNVLDGVKFYKAFDMDRFMRGKQYAYLKRQRDRLEHDLKISASKQTTEPNSK